MLGACGGPRVDRSSQATPKEATQDTEVNKPEPKAVQEKAEPTIAEDQAMLSAQDYLDYSSFSRTGLIDQLVFEGFTQKQATFGVNQTGL